MKRLLKDIIIVMVLGFMAIYGGIAHAGSGSAEVRVYARVLPVLSAQVVDQTGAIEVTRADVERGYVEIHSGTVLRVKTNSSYVIYFERAVDAPFSEIQVDSGTTVVSIVSSGGAVYEPYPGVTGYMTKVINYRFYLADNATPGLYPWPVMVGVMAN